MNKFGWAAFILFAVVVSYCTPLDAGEIEFSIGVNIYQFEVTEDETNNGGPPQPISLIQLRYQHQLENSRAFFYTGWTHMSSIPTKESDCECSDIDIIGLGVGWRWDI